MSLKERNSVCHVLCMVSPLPASNGVEVGGNSISFIQFFNSMPCFVTTETEGSWNTVIADGHFMLEDNNEGITNGTLIIMDIKIEDRDNYMCYAINELGSHNSTTLIRVIGNMPKKIFVVSCFIHSLYR